MSHLETLIGRNLEPSEQHSVPTLNELPPLMLEEARKLARVSRPMAVSYLQYHVAEAAVATDFCDDVLLGTHAMATWGIRAVLCYRDLSIDELMNEPVEEMIAEMGVFIGERWYRKQPNREFTESRGAPGVLVRAANYLWKRPLGAASVVAGSDIEQIADANIVIAFRRWIASRIGWQAEDYLSTNGVTAAGILAALAHDPASVSVDASVAISALVHEAALLRSAETDLPLGYMGPDDWYR